MFIFYEARNQTVLLGILCDVTGSKKTNTYISMSRPDSNGYTYVFGIQRFDKTTRNKVKVKVNFEIYIADRKATTCI